MNIFLDKMEISEMVSVNSRVTDRTHEAHVMKLVSDRTRQIIEIVNYVVLCGLISVFGTASNLINLVVFYKQGLNTTINISFFALAISDLSSLLLQLWYSICTNPLFQNSDIPMVPLEIMYITGGVPRVTCARITFLITVYVTAERCLCIAFPLHVKQMITPRRTIIVMVAVYIVTIFCAVPLFSTNNIDWKFYPEKNKTLLGQVHTYNRDSVEKIVYIIQSIVGIMSFVAVVALTGVLVRKLHEKSSWRQTVSVDTGQSESMTTRDRKTINLIVLIACILIVCNTPGVLMFMATFFEPGLSAGGKYSNLFFVGWSLGFLFETINSSVNIFLYMKMSTKYRVTFQAIFTTCRHTRKEITKRE